MSNVEEDCMDTDNCSEVGDESNLAEVRQQLAHFCLHLIKLLSASDKIAETYTNLQLLVKYLKYLQKGNKLTNTRLMLMNDLVKTKPLSELITRSISISVKGGGSASIKYDKKKKNFFMPSRFLLFYWKFLLQNRFSMSCHFIRICTMDHVNCVNFSTFNKESFHKHISKRYSKLKKS